MKVSSAGRRVRNRAKKIEAFSYDRNQIIMSRIKYKTHKIHSYNPRENLGLHLVVTFVARAGIRAIVLEFKRLVLCGGLYVLCAAMLYYASSVV